MFFQFKKRSFGFSSSGKSTYCLHLWKMQWLFSLLFSARIKESRAFVSCDEISFIFSQRQRLQSIATHRKTEVTLLGLMRLQIKFERERESGRERGAAKTGRKGVRGQHTHACPGSCVCVCVCICMCICVRLCAFGCVHLCEHLYVCFCAFVCVRMCVHLCVSVFETAGSWTTVSF